MSLIANLLVALVAISHIGFLALEMYFWTRPLGLKIFRNTQEFANASAVLAANQGLYNGFLAAGLIWALWGGQMDLKVFFLGCVIIAGIYGGYTVNWRLFRVQALPAIFALGAVLLSAT